MRSFQVSRSAEVHDGDVVYGLRGLQKTPEDTEEVDDHIQLS